MSLMLDDSARSGLASVSQSAVRATAHWSANPAWRTVLRGVLRRSLPLITAALGACTAEGPAGVAAPPPPNDPRAAYRAIAFALDFNLRTGTVTVSTPGPGTQPWLANAVAPTEIRSAPGASFSLLGSGVVNLRTSNFTAGAIGAVARNKILIRTDLAIVNPLIVALVTPTFPVPPVGVTGVQAFPFEIYASQRAADGGTGQLLISPPTTGPVQPSLDWDGAPHNFLNDLACGLPMSDCFPYKAYPEVSPLATSPARSVGFLVDVSVTEFRVTMLLAADLRSVQMP